MIPDEVPGWLVQTVRSTNSLVFLICNECYVEARPVLADPMTGDVLRFAAVVVDPCACKVEERRAA